MKSLKTSFQNLKLIKTSIHRDNRGFFKEVFQKKIAKKYNFIFDCVSHSKKNVLRGLHFQKKNPQAKLLTVVYGKIFDVCVDLRKTSKTYGKYFAIKMSDKSNISILIPSGFAHGFLCLSNYCVIYYKCSKYRNKKSEKTIMWNDSKLNIKWPKTKVILSKKDSKGISFDSLK